MRNFWLGGTIAIASALALATPAAAQDSSYKVGPVWDVGMIDVEDGQFENYMDWLTREWRTRQAFAKSQGWILDYHILSNISPREGEPDLYLITRYADFVSIAESERRDKIIEAQMKMDAHAMDKASGDRVKMRRQMGGLMLRELNPR